MFLWPKFNFSSSTLELSVIFWSWEPLKFLNLQNFWLKILAQNFETGPLWRLQFEDAPMENLHVRYIQFSIKPSNLEGSINREMVSGQIFSFGVLKILAVIW